MEKSNKDKIDKIKNTEKEINKRPAENSGQEKAFSMTEEEVQKAKRDYGLGIYGSKKRVNVKLVDAMIGCMVVAVIVCILLFSRSPGYRVHFDTAGASEIEDQLLRYDEKIVQPEDPQKPGYVFEGWYLSNGHRWDFETDLVGNDMVLTAHYTIDPRVLDAIQETENK